MLRNISHNVDRDCGGSRLVIWLSRFVLLWLSQSARPVEQNQCSRLKTDTLVVTSFHRVINIVTIVFINLSFTLFLCRLLDATDAFVLQVRINQDKGKDNCPRFNQR